MGFLNNQNFRYAGNEEVRVYELGNYGEHILWFSINVEERGPVSWILDFMNYRHPDYLQTLQAWAQAAPAQREKLLDQHVALLTRLTENMRL